jgi:RNA polymerase sigma-70 factor (ECF subfamily)
MLVEAMTLDGRVDAEAQRIAQGLRLRDVALIHQLVEHYQLRLVRYLIYFTGRREHVEDLVQETWLRVLEHGNRYDGRSRFQSWLFAIARHLAIDHFRRRRDLSLDTGSSPDKGPLSEPPTKNEPSPFEIAARTEDALRLSVSLNLLDPIYREALLLRFEEDLSLQEIANIVEAPVTTVSSRIYRGLEMLRSQFEGESNEK